MLEWAWSASVCFSLIPSLSPCMACCWKRWILERGSQWQCCCSLTLFLLPDDVALHCGKSWTFFFLQFFLISFSILASTWPIDQSEVVERGEDVTMGCEFIGHHVSQCHTWRDTSSQQGLIMYTTLLYRQQITPLYKWVLRVCVCVCSLVNRSSCFSSVSCPSCFRAQGCGAGDRN